MEAEGFQVVREAVDGREALTKVEHLKPDVVLLDIQLPDLDGFVVADRLATDARATAASAGGGRRRVQRRGPRADLEERWNRIALAVGLVVFTSWQLVSATGRRMSPHAGRRAAERRA